MKRIALLLIALLFSFKTLAEEPGQWLMNYYKTPNPSDFTFEVKKLSKSGLLGNPKHKQNIAVFLSQIMAANPDKTSQWLNELQDLNKADMAPVFYAVWLSDTKESKAYLNSIGAKKALEMKPINFLQVEVDNPNVLDALWSYFFATGKAEPIRKTISALNYADYDGSLEAYKTSKKTEEDKRKAFLESVYKSARWSLESNIKQHHLVGEICGNILEQNKLTNNEQLWLGVILSKTIPSKYKMVQVKAGEWILETYK